MNFVERILATHVYTPIQNFRKSQKICQTLSNVTPVKEEDELLAFARIRRKTPGKGQKRLGLVYNHTICMRDFYVETGSR